MDLGRVAAGRRCHRRNRWQRRGLQLRSTQMPWRISPRW
jgi:hypothetical protein